MCHMRWWLKSRDLGGFRFDLGRKNTSNVVNTRGHRTQGCLPGGGPHMKNGQSHSCYHPGLRGIKSPLASSWWLHTTIDNHCLDSCFHQEMQSDGIPSQSPPPYIYEPELFFKEISFIKSLVPWCWQGQRLNSLPQFTSFQNVTVILGILREQPMSYIL